MSSLQPHLSHPKYRSDIDGLRAIAVLSVVLFHAFPSWLKGGFIGVDVFFVISGYLISTIIFENLDRGTFSFIEFYIRRVNRIFPALTLVLIASYALGWVTLLPDEYKQLGKHIAAGAGFVSNIVLWDEAGYFDKLAETKPLLHLWSLGIEEQFYFAWPLLLWLTWKQKFNLLTVTILVAIISFYLNVKGVSKDAVATFYSPQTRFWELLCGSLLAWMTLYKNSNFASITTKLDGWLVSAAYWEKRDVDGKILSNVLSFVGLLLLAYGFLRINKELSFPGKWAIVPVLGAALIILAGPKALVNRSILSNKVAVWFGLISFPLYLWHWPLLSFARIVESEVPSRNIRITAVFLSVLLAWLTYKLIERPIRLGKQSNSKVITLVALMGLVGCIGYITFKSDGLGFRFPKIVQELTSHKYEYEKDYRLGTCFLKEEQDFKAFSKCESETSIDGKTVLLWGDSHAAHLYPGYKATFGKNLKILQRTASGCPPILDLEVQQRVHCKNINNDIFSLIKDMRVDYVVLAADWTNYDLIRLDKTILRLKGIGVKNIDLIGPVPHWVDGLPKQLYRFQLYRFFKTAAPHIIPERMSFGLSKNFIEFDNVLRRIALKFDVRYISAKDILCDNSGCLTRLGNTGETLTAWDQGHLTTLGSEYLVSRFPKF